MAHIDSQLERAQLENIADGSKPAAGTRGRAWWNNDLAKAEVDTGGVIRDLVNEVINYISNPGAEGSVLGWATYADAAAAVPVDGTGGAPSSTYTRTVVSPLRGEASFELSKSAADRQGEGASFDFAIDDADQSSSITIQFDYAATANFVAGVSSDVQVYIYDIDGAAIIVPTDVVLLTATGTFATTFAATAATNYRLILHIATTNALAWDLKVDGVTVKPEDLVSAPVRSVVRTAVINDTSGAAVIDDEAPSSGSWISSVLRPILGTIEITMLGGVFNDPDNVDVQVQTRRGAALASIRIEQVDRPSTFVIRIQTIVHSSSLAADNILYVQVTEPLL